MFTLASEPINIEELKTRLSNAHAGAYVSFEGWVRNHNDGRTVTGLEYQVYGALAAKEGRLVLDEAMDRFEIVEAWCVHRCGELRIGDTSVWVGVSAAHRDAAFAAARYVIDQIKIRLPIWKKELYVDGTTEWVNCRHESHGASGATHGAAS